MLGFCAGYGLARKARQCGDVTATLVAGSWPTAVLPSSALSPRSRHKRLTPPLTLAFLLGKHRVFHLRRTTRGEHAKACHDLLYISGDFRRLYPVDTA
jgi:hypothetical protein